MKTGSRHIKWQHYREQFTVSAAYDFAMKASATNQVFNSSPPELDGFEIKRRPFIGFGLLAATLIGTLAVLIYFGAWASADRVENRALAAGIPESQQESEWWADGLIYACPLH